MLVHDSHTLKILSHSPEQTRRIGIQLGKSLQTGDAICLQGDLGAGKTTFVQGIAQGWGSLDSVSSPTFILVNEYHRNDESRLFHMDAYRIDSTLEAEQLDLDWMLARGALLIEWPERMPGLIPEENLWITLDHIAETERDLKFTAAGKRHRELIDVIHNIGGE